jgi:hypothetical protein
MNRNRSLLFVSLFTVVAGAYFTLQCTTDLVWDDSPRVCSSKYDSQPPFWYTRPDPIRSLFSKSFGSLTLSGYRPLNALQQSVARWHIAECEGGPALWYLGGAIVFGLFAVVVYCVARRFTCTERGALLAVFLLLFSTPIITGGWPVVCNCQATVPLAICGGLLIYWRLVEFPSYRVPLTVALGGLFLFGPWLREFVGLLPVLVILEEVRRKKRPTWVTGLACVAFAHALYPTALMKWLAFPELPLAPVFRLGSLGGVLNTTAEPFGTIGWFFTQVHLLKWDVPYHFLVLLPPSLMVLTAIGWFVPPPRRWCTMIPEGGAFVAACGLFLMWYGCITAFLFATNSPQLGLWLVLGVAATLFRIHGFLAVWFLLSFLPFLRVFTEQVHLAYALLPACIGIAASIENLFLRLRAPGWLWGGLRAAAACVVLIAVADHALNLYSSFYVVTRINQGARGVADWFEHHVPERSIVICNALHAEDIRLRSGNHFTAYWTVSAGIPHPSRDVSDPDALERVLAEHPAPASRYFLDVAFPYRPDKVGYHSHKYVREQSVRTEPCGVVHVVRARYPFLDPLKHWTPRRFMSFLGPPDLENDYYTGPARDGSFFFRELYAEYHVYSVVGSRVLPRPGLTAGR